MFEDYFSIYEQVKPPKAYKNYNQKLGLYNYEDKKQDSHSDIRRDNTTVFTSNEFPGISNPFNDEAIKRRYPFLAARDEGIDTGSDSQKAAITLDVDIQDLLESQGIVSINGKKIKFGSRAVRTSNIGSPTSHHRERNPYTGYANARDISIVGGTIQDYEDLKRVLVSNPVVRKYMDQMQWGIINEVTPAILSLTGGTGMHFHFGPDKWARNTWKHWTSSDDYSVTENLKDKKYVDNGEQS